MKLAVLILSPVEEAFFRAGEALSANHEAPVLDGDEQPRSVWGSVVGWLRGERAARAV